MRRLGRAAVWGLGLGLLGVGALGACNSNDDAVGPERAPIYDAPDEVDRLGTDRSSSLVPVTPLPLEGTGTGPTGATGGAGHVLEDETALSASTDGGSGGAMSGVGGSGDVSGAPRTDGGTTQVDLYGTSPAPNTSGAGSMGSGSAGTPGTTPATGGSGATAPEGLSGGTQADPFDARDGVPATPPTRDGGM